MQTLNLKFVNFVPTFLGGNTQQTRGAEFTASFKIIYVVLLYVQYKRAFISSTLLAAQVISVVNLELAPALWSNNKQMEWRIQ